MRIGQAIDLIIEDNNKEFKSGKYELYNHDYFGIVILDIYKREIHPNVLGEDFISLNWTEIAQPVSFMKASQSGKKITVKHNSIAEDYISGFYNLNRLLEKLIDRYSTNQVRQILSEGEFYIKED